MQALPNQTPNLHLNLDGNAEDNRNWALIDAAIYTLMAQLGITPGQQQLYYLLAGAFAGVPTNALSIGIWIASMSFTLPAGLTGSQAHSKVAAAASSAFPITVNGVQQGTITWAAGAQTGTFTLATAVAVNPGDIIELMSPATADTALSDLVWTIKGTI